MNSKRTILLFTFLMIIFLLAGCDMTGVTPVSTPAASPAPAVTLSVDGTAAVLQSGPQVVQQTPLSADRLALNGNIQLVFDREMDKEKTAAAWAFTDSNGKPVKGTVSWKDARTFNFQPDSPLQASATYHGAFSTLTEVALTFHTVDALAVGQVFPADTAEDIEVGSNLTVIFNRPIVPIDIKEEQGKLPQPLHISPAVAGHGQWLNSSVYIFQPDQPLSSGTQYKVQVAAGLADVTGNTLASDYSWQFRTRAPEIAHFSLLNGEQDPQTEMGLILLNQAFVIDFLQPMNPTSVKNALTLVNRESKKPFATQLTWNKDFTQLTITPVGHYLIASFYDLTLANSAQSSSGGTLKAGLTFKFSTVPFPAIEQVYPSAGSKATSFNSSLWIQFQSPMNFDSMKDKIKITPPPATDIYTNMYYDENERKLYVHGLAAATDYVVRILPGMADLYGNTIQTEYSFSFKTGNLSASGQMLMSYAPLIFRPTSAQEFFFEYTNLSSVTFGLYRMTNAEFVASRLSAAQNGVVTGPKSKPIREWKPDLQQANNKVITEKIKLQDDQGKALEPGYYFIEMKAPQLTNGSKGGAAYQAAVFIVATDNITLKTTPSEALAWVVDLETGQPVANVPVVIYNNQYTEIGRSKTDDKGLVYMKGLNTPYFVQLDDAQHVAAASNDWGSGVSPYDFGISQNYYSGASEMPFGYVYTDRPLYRPGQDVSFKGDRASER